MKLINQTKDNKYDKETLYLFVANFKINKNQMNGDMLEDEKFGMRCKQDYLEQKDDKYYCRYLRGVNLFVLPQKKNFIFNEEKIFFWDHYSISFFKFYLLQAK